MQKIAEECEREGIITTQLLSLLLKRIERVGAKETYRELKALSELMTSRSRFLEQIKIKDWVNTHVPHYRYTFTDIDHLASYKNRLMLIEYKYFNPTTVINSNSNGSSNSSSRDGDRVLRNAMNLLTHGQRITFAYMDTLLREGASIYPHARYEGFYIIALDNMDIDKAETICINNERVTKDELKDFLSFRSRRKYASINF